MNTSIASDNRERMLLDHAGNYIKYELQLALNQSHSVPRYPYLHDYNVNWNSHTR